MASMGFRGGARQPHIAQDKRERHDRERDQHHDPEGVHIGQERRLGLHLLSDPGDGLLLRLGL